jgi:hypothetical protein
MLNILRKFLRPTLREQLEDGVREALRKYADRETAPDLRVFVSSDLLPEGVDAELWARDEAEHLRAFAVQWAQDHHISRTGLRAEVVLLDTRREFAFVKPLGLPAGSRPAEPAPTRASPPALEAAAGGPSGARPDRSRGQPVLEVVSAPEAVEPVVLAGETVLGRRDEEGVRGLGDRYMSRRHAQLRSEGGRVWVTDLDSKNRTFVNEEPIPPHQPLELREGDTLRMGTTTLRVTHRPA